MARGLDPLLIHGYVHRQKHLLRRTYDRSWHDGVGGYEPDADPPSHPQTPREIALKGLTGAALLAARRTYPYVPPKLPDPVPRAVALAPSFRGLNRMGAELANLSQGIAPQIVNASSIGSALSDWADANAWRLDGGDSVAWAGEQAGYAEAADADGYLLQWLSEDDQRVCDGCLTFATFSPMVLADWPALPGDGTTECNVGCFAPDTPVEGAFVGGLEAFYAGQMVELETASGARVTLTPNHPVATSKGFAPAGTLREGDYLFHRVGGDSPVTSAGGLTPAEDVDHGPATIQQVFRALEKRHGTLRTKPRGKDLHGDGLHVEGQIKVVAPHGDLARRRYTRFEKHRRDFTLEGAVALGAAQGTVARREFTVAHLPARDRLPRRSALALHCRSVVAHRLPLQALRSGTATQFDAPLLQPAGKSRAADAKFLAQLRERGTPHIIPDQIVKVHRVRYWRGHVYDLQSTTGWLLAGSLVCSNCRCSMEAVLDIIPNDTYTPQLSAAQDDFIGEMLTAQSQAMADMMPDAAYLD